MTMTLRAYQSTPIPRHILGDTGIMTLISDAPLTNEWARTFAAHEHTVQLRPVDIIDVTGNYPRAFSDQLDLEDDRERALTTYRMWVVSRSHPSFKAAEAQLYHIGHLSQATASLSRSRYLDKAEQLRREGYTQHAIDSVPRPPPEVPALHWDTDCRGELRKGSLKTDVPPGWTIPYCPRCGWVQQAEWRPRHPRQITDLQDRGPLLLPQNPDAFAISEDSEGEGPSVARQQREQANAYRSLKAAGALLPAEQISTLPHAPALATLEKQIARGQVRSWPDPDAHAWLRRF